MKLLIPIGWQVECLHTNDSLVAHDIIAKIEMTPSEFSAVINTFFEGRPPLGAVTLTLVKKIGGVEQRVYYSYYPTGVLHIGNIYRLVVSQNDADRYKVWPKDLAQPAIKETTDLRDTSYKPYKIYHMSDPDWSPIVKEQQPREYAGMVFANTLEEAFRYAQNDSSGWAIRKKRSTSVGDVIEEDGTCYLVAGIGFKLLPDVKFAEATGVEVDEWAYEQYQQSILEDLSKPRLETDAQKVSIAFNKGEPTHE